MITREKQASTPIEWTDEELSDRCKRVTELQSIIELTKAELDICKAGILEYLRSRQQKTCLVDGFAFSATKKRTVVYSRSFDRDLERLKKLHKDQIDSMKRVEEKNCHDPKYKGDQQAEITIDEFHHLTIKALAPEADEL
tara:strand:- start:288 stop:707 length:420 start_codon:yes stop_codon:yes gene_type:complete